MWWAISFHRGADRQRSQSRRSQPCFSSGGTGSGIVTSISASIRDRSMWPSARDHTNSSQANGSASTNVTSSPADVDSRATVVAKLNDRDRQAPSGCSPSCAAAAAGGARAGGG